MLPVDHLLLFALAAYAVYRATQRPSVRVEDTATYAPMSPASTPIAVEFAQEYAAEVEAEAQAEAQAEARAEARA